MLKEDLDLNVLNPAFDRRRTFEAYARLREERPIARFENAPEPVVWFASRYDDALTILKDPRFVKDWLNTLDPERRAQHPLPSGVENIITRHMLYLDAPDHSRLRALVSRGFTARTIEGMRDRVQAIADELLDTVQQRGHMDLIDDYAFQLPFLVIAEMLGVPVADRDRLREWTSVVVSPTPTPESWQRTVDSLMEFIAYMNSILQQRRVAPRDDLISMLAQAEQSGEMREDELLPMILLLLVAGHETTTNLIANGIVALHEHPAQLELLRNSPALIKTAVEELLRWEGPFETATNRWAAEDIVINNTTIKRGERVIVALAAANRDPRYFDDPEVLDIAREANRHAAFGHGAHFCIGAPLARMEGQIAIETLLRRMPRLSMAEPVMALKFKPGLLLRGYVSVPMTF